MSIQSKMNKTQINYVSFKDSFKKKTENYIFIERFWLTLVPPKDITISPQMIT